MKLAEFSEKISKKLLTLKRHWVALLLMAAFTFASGVQATSWLIAEAARAYESNIGWKGKEEKILNSISANMQIGLIKQILGEPIYKNGGEKYTEYVFRRPAEWIQVVVDNNGRAQMYAINICDSNFKPTIKVLPSLEVKMMEDTLYSKGSGETRYFISGATSNSYLLEGSYLGNPGNYQSVYMGATDGCGTLNAPEKSYELLETKNCKDAHLGLQGFSEPYCQYDIENSEIENMRKSVRIDTLAITAPNVSAEDLSPRSQIGVDRIMMRVLPNYYNDGR